jgi:beta-mannosidase
MRRTIELDGPGWTIEGFLSSDAAGRAAAMTGPRPAAIPASVPGSILDELRRANQVPDPYAGLNSLAAEWVPERAWLYRRWVDVPSLEDGERAWLAFDGLDHAGEVLWDGAPIARHEGMFVPFEVALDPRLVQGGSGGSRGTGERGGPGGTGEGRGAGERGGRHELAVVIDPAPEGESQLGRTSRVRHHKSRMTYGWDFCPRMIHQGLWQSVRLEIAGDVRIVDLWGRARLSDDGRRATVEARIRLEAAAARPVRLEAEVIGPSRGDAGTDVDLPPGETEAVLRVDVEEPALWWPNGAGEAVVHRLRVRVLGHEGALDETTVPLGFRTVERIPNEGGPPGAPPWTWVVNGRRLYVRGWNWVPLDVQYGVPRPERLGHLLRLAWDAGVNLLRVWGGGLIETRGFYDACDAHGILVWQELGQSSSLTDALPSDDPDFVGRMAAEARAIVPLRRNHPSLAAWCGGNELEGPAGPLDDGAPVLGALRDVVEELDPGRAWLPTSPSGPRFHNRLDVIEADPDGLHDVHGPWEHQGLEAQHELYDRGTSLFNSEFGAEGLTNRRTHAALIGPEDRWPATRANRVYRHLGDWWINEPLVQAAFGGRLTDLETLRRASQHLQAEGLRYAIEANRRRAFRNSGSIPWQLNESYPNAWCTSAVDHRGDPKPAYFAVRRAYAPIVVSASFARTAWGGEDRFEAAIWAWSDGTPLAGASAIARVVDVHGAELARADLEVDLDRDLPARLGAIALAPPFPPIFLLDLRLVPAAGVTVATNRYLFSGVADLAPVLDVDAANVRVEVAADSDAWQVALAHVAGATALGVRLEDDRPIEARGWAEAEDAGFDMLPGETRTIVVRWADDTEPGARRLRLSGWNVAGTTVTA